MDKLFWSEPLGIVKDILVRETTDGSVEYVATFDDIHGEFPHR